MTLKASDLPEDGSSKLCLIDGTLFEVQRERSTMDARRSVYKARMLPTPAGIVPVPDSVAVDGFHEPYKSKHRMGGGWWYRFTWKLMLADLKLMAKEDEE